MAVKYKVSPTRSPQNEGGQVRYIARPTKRGKAGLNELSAYIADRTTLSRPDVMAVVYAFADAIPWFLMKNENVHIPPLGVFSLSYKSENREKPEEVNKHCIKQMKIQFRPNKELTDTLKKAEITKA